MSLLAFPDEILLDIFDYLYFYEIIYSFYELIHHNDRIHELINTRHHSINLSKIDLRYMTKSQFMFTCRYIKSRENCLEKIHYLTLSNQYTFGEIRLFLSLISFDQMINLKKLYLIQPALDEYHILFPTKLSHLTHLTLENPECNDNNRIILIDEMNELIELNIISKSAVQFRSEYCRLEKLTVSQLNFIDLIGFSTFFPNLHYLDITLTGTEIDLNQIRIPLLTILKLRSFDVEHDLCEKFLLNLLQLRELYYSNTIQCTKTFIVDGYRCQSLIERLPLLEQFEINLYLCNTYATDICEITASFQSPFFLERQWNIVCESRPNSNEYHVYSVPMPSFSELNTTTDSLVSSAVLHVDDPYANVDHLKLNMTSNWPLVTRFFSNVDTLELVQLNHSKMIPTVSVLSYLNKSIFLSKIRKLILPSPCHFDDSLLRYLLQQSAQHIDKLDIPCHYLLRLIKTNMLQSPLPIRILTLRDNYLSLNDRAIFIDFFNLNLNLNCLSLYLQNNNSFSETIQLFLEQFQFLYSLNVFTYDPISMLVHVQLCQMIQQRPQASAELRPTNIRIWQK
ncbi:unnamed protein product [Rotaria sp. Silwood1]|nr:unnamed protein product [Rotaria sp. Silwood1]CAF3340841.1 unnamed protein product [Rotaria sp. Silwood1]CAF4581554.1 unnamed protein product [Rotaria sp. Silwood1]CAF4652277.1 unnamed protein product [Rotaria sp. Silwood1]